LRGNSVRISRHYRLIRIAHSRLKIVSLWALQLGLFPQRRELNQGIVLSFVDGSLLFSFNMSLMLRKSRFLTIYLYFLFSLTKALKIWIYSFVMLLPNIVCLTNSVNLPSLILGGAISLILN